MSENNNKDVTDKKSSDNKNIMKATKKYRRLKTIVNKVSEFAKICNVKLSVLIFDPKPHKL